MVEQRLSEKQDDGSAGPDVSDIQMCLKSWKRVGRVHMLLVCFCSSQVNISFIEQALCSVSDL